MPVKVIACDMDGTFLDEKGNFNRERFIPVLEELEKRGIRFVVASGNAMPRLRLIFGDLVDRISFVAENGGFVLEGNEPLIHHSLIPSDVEAFLDYFKNDWENYRLMVSGEQWSYMVGSAFKASDFPMVDAEQMKLFIDRIKVLDNFSELPDHPVLKLGLQLPLDICDQVIAAFNRDFRGQLTAVTSGYGTVDVIQAGVHKAWGLQHLLDRWDLSWNQVMAFGDGENDRELLEASTYSYAMDNAPESVKKVARFLAPDHRENGVLEILEAYLKGELDFGGKII